MRKKTAIALFTVLLAIPLASAANDSKPPVDNPGKSSSLAARLTIEPLLDLYQNHLTAFTVTQCPSWPNCSHYSRLSVRKHGAIMGIFMTVDRLMHEGAEIKQGQKVFIKGKGLLVYDPLENNDYWWSEPQRAALPDIPQMKANETSLIHR